jgi:vacuolar-type H+-ATPase subunit I/STV1
MKLAIIIGFVHMLFAIILNGLNIIKKKKKL